MDLSERWPPGSAGGSHLSLKFFKAC